MILHVRFDWKRRNSAGEVAVIYHIRETHSESPMAGRFEARELCDVPLRRWWGPYPQIHRRIHDEKSHYGQ